MTTWRANTKSLTLNLGVRWELYYPESVNGPGNGALLNMADGYIRVAGFGGIKSDMGWQLDKKKQFAPRLGATYQLNPKTVIRVKRLCGRSFDIGVFGSIFGHTSHPDNVPVSGQPVHQCGECTTPVRLRLLSREAPPRAPDAITPTTPKLRFSHSAADRSPTHLP